MKLSKQFTSVTPFSKLLALTLFILLPLLMFFLGIFYEQSLLLPLTIRHETNSVIMTPPPLLSPEEVTSRFYQDYLACLKSSNYFFPQERCGHGDDMDYTAHFLHVLQNRDVKGDPVTCSQNIPPSIRIEHGTEDKYTASLIVRENFPIENIVHVDLKLQNNAWKIDTVTCI